MLHKLYRALAALSVVAVISIVEWNLSPSLLAQTVPPKAAPKKATTIKKRPLKATGPLPVGVIVQLSDGTQQVYPLGVWLMFDSGKLRAVMPTQYVDQIAVLQTDGITWKYPKPGRNVQVWRNGVLQRKGADYTLDQANAIITPIALASTDPVTGLPTSIHWNTTDYVTVAYLY